MYLGIPEVNNGRQTKIDSPLAWDVRRGLNTVRSQGSLREWFRPQKTDLYLHKIWASFRSAG